MERTMNNKYKKAGLVASVLAMSIAVPGIAQAATGFTESRTTLYAGPDDDYPPVNRLKKNTRVEVHGCIDRYEWCDVSVGRNRGWIAGDDLRLRNRGRSVRVPEYAPVISLPTLTFSFDTYWDNNYRRSTFYRDRANWRQRSMRDQDRDGVPNRVDRDQDGDGIANGRDRDRDGDGVRNRNDPAPRNPRRD
jgi:uncharacterized protein YraI